MHLLIPIDLGTPSRLAISAAALLGRVTPLEATLLHVEPSGLPSLTELEDLYTLAAPLRAANVATRLRSSRGDPSEVIVREAEKRKVDAILMGTRGQQPGSVARAVMAIAQIPVLAIRPGEEEGFGAGPVALDRSAATPFLHALAWAFAESLQVDIEALDDATDCSCRHALAPHHALFISGDLPQGAAENLPCCVLQVGGDTSRVPLAAPVQFRAASG